MQRRLSAKAKKLGIVSEEDVLKLNRESSINTNVVVAAFITENLCSKILLRGRKRQFHLIACPFILRGLEHVLIHIFSLRKNEVRSTLQIVSEAFHGIVRP